MVQCSLDMKKPANGGPGGLVGRVERQLRKGPRDGGPCEMDDVGDQAMMMGSPPFCGSGSRGLKLSRHSCQAASN